MLYVQITTKCNFACAHCMFSCRPGTGMHMDIKTFKAAGKFAQDHDFGIFIGGGEPTLHPQFWEIAGLCMGFNARFCQDAGCPPLNLVTNGSRTKDALKLASLAASGYASVRLSRDQFHMPFKIADSVVQAFKRHRYGDLEERVMHRDADERDYRQVGGEIINVVPLGRAKRNGYTSMAYPGRTGCVDGMYVDPSGAIWRCACKKEQLGTVFKPAYVDWSDENVQDGCTTRHGRLVADMARDGLLISRDAADAEGVLFREPVADLPEVATQLTETKEGVAL